VLGDGSAGGATGDRYGDGQRPWEPFEEAMARKRSEEEAATRIQAATRGNAARLHADALNFLRGPPPPPPQPQPQPSGPGEPGDEDEGAGSGTERIEEVIEAEGEGVGEGGGEEAGLADADDPEQAAAATKLQAGVRGRQARAHRAAATAAPPLPPSAPPSASPG